MIRKYQFAEISATRSGGCLLPRREVRSAPGDFDTRQEGNVSSGRREARPTGGSEVTAELVHVGFGNLVAMNRVTAITTPDSAPIRHLLKRLRETQQLIDMTRGRKTKSVIFLDNGQVALAPIEPRFIAGRHAKEHGEADVAPVRKRRADREGVSPESPGDSGSSPAGGRRPRPTGARGPRVPLLVVVSGPSGAGKDSLVERLRAAAGTLPEPRPHFAITATTRPPRASERDGVDYYFHSDAGFAELEARGGLLESATVYGHHYGVPRQPIEDALARGQDVFVKTDVQGAATIRRQVAGALTIFLTAPSLEVLEARLRARAADSEAALATRLATARAELECAASFDYVVTNHPGRLDEAVAAVEAICSAERLRSGRTPPRILPALR